MSYNVGDTVTDADVNTAISLFCKFYEHHEGFDYTPDTLQFDTCKLQILNGIFSDEELIVETPLQISISDEKFPNQNYYLALDYYSYGVDDDNELPELQHGYFPLELNDGIAEIDFDDADVVYIKLENWELITKFDKPIITEVT
jgi:hypothetical protein